MLRWTYKILDSKYTEVIVFQLDSTGFSSALLPRAFKND